MKIDVTAEDIAQGIPLSIIYCPVARAMRRALGEDVGVGVDVWSRYRGPLLMLPDFVSANISKMLIGEAVEPFSFDVEDS